MHWSWYFVGMFSAFASFVVGAMIQAVAKDAKAEAYGLFTMAVSFALMYYFFDRAVKHEGPLNRRWR